MGEQALRTATGVPCGARRTLLTVAAATAARRTLLAVALAAGLWSGPVFAQPVPPLEDRVNDRADMIAPDVEQRIEDGLAALEEETGAQVAVLTVDSLEGGSLEDFSIRVVEAWQLGREDVDDGVLLLVSRDDRLVRIEVGYGLEGAIPDVYAHRIIDEQLTPRFRAGDFGGGIEVAVASLGGLIRGEELPPPSPESEWEFDTGNAITTVLTVLLMAALALPRVLAWILYLIGAPIVFAAGHALFGLDGALGLVLLWLIAFPVLRAVMRSGIVSRGGWGTGGPWSTGGGGGGSFGGGFSGGGGSFGGGGASGSW